MIVLGCSLWGLQTPQFLLVLNKEANPPVSGSEVVTLKKDGQSRSAPVSECLCQAIGDSGECISNRAGCLCASVKTLLRNGLHIIVTLSSCSW